jgi:hypothetical protein
MHITLAAIENFIERQVLNFKSINVKKLQVKTTYTMYAFRQSLHTNCIDSPFLYDTVRITQIKADKLELKCLELDEFLTLQIDKSGKIFARFLDCEYTFKFLRS